MYKQSLSALGLFGGYGMAFFLLPRLFEAHMDAAGWALMAVILSEALIVCVVIHAALNSPGFPVSVPPLDKKEQKKWRPLSRVSGIGMIVIGIVVAYQRVWFSPVGVGMAACMTLQFACAWWDDSLVLMKRLKTRFLG